MSTKGIIMKQVILMGYAASILLSTAIVCQQHTTVMNKATQTLFQAIATNNIEMAKIVLADKDIKINRQDEFGNTPLHLAVQAGNQQLLELLLDHKANPNIQDNAGNTPLHDTIILTAGSAGTGTFISADPARIKLFDLLIQHGADPKIKNNEGKTVTDYAILSGNLLWTQKALALGANINTKDQNGNTPLHLAVQAGNQQLVEFLLDHKANPNIQDNAGNTPLHDTIRLTAGSAGTGTFISADPARIKLFDLLIQHGADPKIKNNEGKTAQQLLAEATKK